MKKVSRPGKIFTSTPKNKKRMILGEKQWNSIVAKVVRPQDKMKEVDDQMLEYLKEGSKKLMSKWPEKQEENGNGSKKDKENIEMSKDEKRYREIQAAGPEKRKELIANAENIVNAGKIKKSLTELNSAAVLCEVLKGREIQREFNKHRKDEVKRKTEKQNREHMAQAGRWIDDYNDKQIEGRRRFNQYKQDLRELVDLRAKERNDEKRERIKVEKSHIEQHFKNERDEASREKVLMEKKKIALRKNALEAMKMAEQRRARLKQADEIQQVVVKIHNEGKDEIKKLIKQQEIEMKIQSLVDKQVLQEEARKLDVEMKEHLKIEQEMIEKVSQQKLEIYDEKEKKRMEQLKQKKKQRIEEHLAEQERRKKEKQEKKEEDDVYFKNRVENDKISTEYVKLKYQKEAEAVKENRKFVVEQIKENQKILEQEKEEKMKFDKSEIEAKDQQFFEYAKELSEDAKAKNRPTLPLIKAVKQYKKHNYLDVTVKELPHVISNVPIGRAHQIEETPNAKKSKARIRYEIDELKMLNPYRDGRNFMRRISYV